MFHDEKFSQYDLVINPKSFPFARIGTLLHIYRKESPNNKLLLKVETLEEVRGNTKISVSKFLGNQFGFHTMAKVYDFYWNS